MRFLLSLRPSERSNNLSKRRSIDNIGEYSHEASDIQNVQTTRVKEEAKIAPTIPMQK
jgi:hypothetical protein